MFRLCLRGKQKLCEYTLCTVDVFIHVVRVLLYDVIMTGNPSTVREEILQTILTKIASDLFRIKSLVRLRCVNIISRGRILGRNRLYSSPP